MFGKFELFAQISWIEIVKLNKGAQIHRKGSMQLLLQIGVGVVGGTVVIPTVVRARVVSAGVLGATVVGKDDVGGRCRWSNTGGCP